MVGEPYFQLAAIALTGVAAYFDFRTGRIPNALTLGTLAVAPIAHTLAYGTVRGWNHALSGLGYSLLGVVACSAVPLVLYFSIKIPTPASAVEGGQLEDATAEEDAEPLRAIYEGDIKLLAALGAVAMVSLGVEMELYAFVTAAVIAAGGMVFRGRLSAVLGNTFVLATNAFVPAARRKDPSPESLTLMRFGPAAFLGTCLCVLLNWRF